MKLPAHRSLAPNNHRNPSIMTSQKIERDTPGLKKLKFSEAEAISFVTRGLREAWKVIPPAPH